MGTTLTPLVPFKLFIVFLMPEELQLLATNCYARGRIGKPVIVILRALKDTNTWPLSNNYLKLTSGSA